MVNVIRFNTNRLQLMEILEIMERLLQMFGEAAKPLRINEISKAVQIKSESSEYDILKTALNELIDQGVIEKIKGRRFRLIDYEDSSKFEGVLRIRNNRGFVETGDKTYKKISVKKRHMLTALDGDSVVVKLLPAKKNNKYRGEIINILDRPDRRISGTIDQDGVFHFLIPDDEKYFNDFLVHQSKLNGAVHGDRVVAKFISWKDKTKSPRAEVIEITKKTKITHAEFVAAEYDSIFEEFFIPREFPEGVIKESEAFPKTINAVSYKDRLDLRKLDIVTIDPDDAKDFDDALSLEILPNGNYYLGVHIADVSHFVPEGSYLDSDSGWRGTSIYLVDRVVPMLPEALSNEICSLKPNRVRLAHTVFMEISPRGAVLDYNIKESIIKSKKRFTYKEVQRIIEGEDNKFKDLVLSLHGLASMLRNKRFKTGGIDFTTQEYKFILDENKIPKEVEVKTTTPATSLVEECMLIANQTVAEFCYKRSKEMNLQKRLPFLFRVHDEPNAEKLSSVVDFFRMLGAKQKLDGAKSRDINNFLKFFNDKPEKPIVNQMLLRTMSKAEYSERNIGHYGLGFKNYTHFTSPIRRYPDLIVHRLTKEYSKENISKNRISKLENILIEIASHSTARERVALEAERASIKLAQSLYAKQFLGEVFEGTISGVTSFGVFVMMDDINCEGLVHMKDMKDDYYVFDERRYRLTGRRKKRVLSIGQRIEVRLYDVNVKRRRVDLLLND